MRKISNVIVFSLVMSFAFSQTTGKIRGTVTSAEGQPLAGANVVVDGTNKGTATDGEGRYTILNVEAGTYSITTSYIGYQSSTNTNVLVKVGLTTPANFSLQTSAVEGEAVTITGDKRLIEISKTNSVRSVGEEEIYNSASRSVGGMLDLQAGVNITNGRLSIRGGRAEEVAYTLDGASITDVVNTGSDIAAIPEALAEISVEAGGYGAHIGGANSGVVRQVLKTGSDNFNGSVRFESGDYGYQDLTATASAPIGENIKTFFAIRSTHTDDHSPAYLTDFSINNGEALESTASGVTPDGESVAIVFDSGGKNGVQHRAKDDLQINGTATLDIGPVNFRLSAVLDNQTRESNVLPIYYMFNTARLPKSERSLQMYNLKANYFVNPNLLVSAGLNLFNRKYESYDDGMGKPESYADVIGWGDSATVASKGLDASYWAGGNTVFAIPGRVYQAPQDYYVANSFAFMRPGDLTTGWYKNERNTLAFDLGLTWQRGNHEIKAGFELKNYTYRKFDMTTAVIQNVNRAIYNGEYSFDQATSGDNSDATTDLKLFNRFGGIGYDDYGREVDSGLNGPREPSLSSIYINDKYEYGDLVVSAGVRVDNFNLDDYKLKDPGSPGWDKTNSGVIEDEFLDSETKSIVQPRLGLAFPVSDVMVFHLQYGRFAQMPELDLPYASTRYMNLVWGGQNYTPDPMGFDLDPIETTQYEVGMSYQFSSSAAIDVTAFAKNTTGQIVIGKNEAVKTGENTYQVATDALYYENGDFTTVNGFEFTYRTNRVNRLQSFASYTWSDARGINSDPNTGAGNLSQEALSPPPLMISPLYYHNKHRGAIALDYRYGSDDGMLSGLGFNLEYKFNSGHPFTLSGGGMGQRAADEGALLEDARSREPLEPIGSSTTPWQYYTNLKVDYNLSLGGVAVTLFAYVNNLFDVKNVINVYSRSGNAYDDGFLTNPELSSEIVAANGQTYVDLYRNVNLENRQHYNYDFGQDVFAAPRIVKMGLSVNF